MRNHTATHLLHAALRQLLGTHVKQAGSVVEPPRLRFDFTHYSALDQAEIEAIERLVNEQILRNVQVETKVMPLDQAIGTGAMALFGEKYGDQVRVVGISDFSKELCGGTHVHHRDTILKIVYEGSISAGVRLSKSSLARPPSAITSNPAASPSLSRPCAAPSPSWSSNGEDAPPSEGAEKQVEQLKNKLAQSAMAT
jgi:alanyl-tRNA synthetase